MLTATKESQEIERKRRLAWEQEQEAKYTQRQAAMERQMLEMRQEIVSLKASFGLNPNMTAIDRSQLGHQAPGCGPLTAQQPTPQTSLSPVSTSSQPHVQAAFVEGSSSRPFQQQPTPIDVHSRSPDSMTIDPPSPQFIAVEGSQLHPHAPDPRNRPTPDAETDGDDETSDSEGDESPPQRSLRRTNGHDSRCLTIQV
jgi:hypothetical protein